MSASRATHSSSREQAKRPWKCFFVESNLAVIEQPIDSSSGLTSVELPLRSRFACRTGLPCFLIRNEKMPDFESIALVRGRFSRHVCMILQMRQANACMNKRCAGIRYACSIAA